MGEKRKQYDLRTINQPQMHQTTIRWSIKLEEVTRISSPTNIKRENIIYTEFFSSLLGAKEVGTQLIDDIARYSKHPDCTTLVCFVYDPEGIIKNPAGIEKDLSAIQNNFEVKVLIRPSGH